MDEREERKRIVICCLTLQYGGAERVISVLSRELRHYYESVELLLYYDGEICYDLDPRIRVTMVERNTHTKSKMKNMLWMRKYLRSNADCVITFLAPLNMLVLVALMGIKVYKITADRSDPSRVPAKKLMRKIRNYLYRMADVVIVQSKRSYNYFPCFIQQKAKIIYNPTSVKKEMRGISLRTEKQDMVVCVGRLVRNKAPYVLFSAFEKFHEYYPTYRLIWYGEGVMRKELEEWIEERHLNKYIVLPGNVKEVAQKIAPARMFVMTSEYEGMPNALIEAMSIGLPCICTEIAGAEDLISDGKNGLLVPVGGIEECCRAMMRLAKDDEYARELGENAVKTAGKLDVENILEQWLEVLKK